MISANQIKSAINQMYVSDLNVNHIYYPTKKEAQLESFRLNKPWFTTHINGIECYSVKIR